MILKGETITGKNNPHILENKENNKDCPMCTWLVIVFYSNNDCNIKMIGLYKKREKKKFWVCVNYTNTAKQKVFYNSSSCL